MLEEREFLLGINNYCLNYHTMNDSKENLSFCYYEVVKKSLFNENFCLTNKKTFKYDKWLTKE